MPAGLLSHCCHLGSKGRVKYSQWSHWSIAVPLWDFPHPFLFLRQSQLVLCALAAVTGSWLESNMSGNLQGSAQRRQSHLPVQHERKQHIHVVHVLVQEEVSGIYWEGDEYRGFHNHCKGAVENSPNRFPQQIRAAKRGDDAVFHCGARFTLQQLCSSGPRTSDRKSRILSVPL